MDEKIGAILEKLKDLGLEENTIVVLQSDHGHSEEERTFGGGGYSGPYRGAKFSLLEGGIRVPAIISWPAALPKNEVRKQFAVNVDWFPTLAELCNIPLPKHRIDGKSIVNIIRSDKASSPHDRFVWQSGGSNGTPQWAVRAGDWKLLHNPLGNKLSNHEKNDQQLYLFNVAEDVEESENRAGEHPDIVKRLYGIYEEWVKDVNVHND